ncbi:MAG: hypothetical protein WBO92_00245 [Candidatus Moraniibacteriota bacterium]
MRTMARKFSLLFLALPVVFLTANVVVPGDFFARPLLLMTALAEEDEEEHEEDEREEDDGEKESEQPKAASKTSQSKPKTVKVVKDVVEYRPVARTVIVTEEAYATDTDGDLLVDAIDPDPKVPQSEYFTDVDEDGVPNAIDRHPDEDDFSYYEFETDGDNNGILDSYEE